MINSHCPYCNNPVNPTDPNNWKGVTGWVHGAKAHGMTLRENTGWYAHDNCIKKIRAKQSPDQESLLDTETDLLQIGDPILVSVSKVKEDEDLARELFDDKPQGKL